ncbi:chromophore lyase CpcT/CpeT [Oscillatoria salina]|uniref:chromophore lyase CpcT/CpeT n=1 Tax=Oscillatoria salina TaxID=331517 RepID=UPI0013B64FE8|nr:chromophore lyase CpcT/CpeT [Oscillatoria salina]MBZ8181661.1 chorismate mutase [Oscillatoria salina IIICB1]NET90166.1 chorismate mutase [Kamptonema sp. SIO1D9]
MNLSPELITLGKYLAGKFDNQEQARSSPTWYVHLHLWHRPVPLFTEDSITLYAEQANIINLNKPYRPRLLRLRQNNEQANSLKVDYYKFHDIEFIKGAGRNPEKLQQLQPEQIEFLPNCTLKVKTKHLSRSRYQFTATSATGKPCSFTYQSNTYHISLGFEVTPEELRIFDKGIDPKTGKATWGAIIGPFRFQKQQDFTNELQI